MLKSITTICIPTKERPFALQRLLQSLFLNLETHNHTPRILISDDSETQEMLDKNKNIILSCSKTYKGKIEIINKAFRKEFAERISKEKEVPLNISLFTFCGDIETLTTLGSVRNIFLYKTKSEHILMLDDDTVCNFYEPKFIEPPCYTYDQPLDYWFLKEKSEIPTLFQKTNSSVVEDHEKYLGKKIEEFFPIFEEIKNMNILDTYFGSVGDSPLESHIMLFLLPNVFLNIDNYIDTKETSFVIRLPLGNTLYKGPMIATMNIGLDNTNFLPPFIPIERAQDFVFGTLKSKIFRNSISLYLPKAMEHDRMDFKRKTNNENIVFEIIKINRVISFIINSIETKEESPYDKTIEIGKELVRLSELPEKEFNIFIKNQIKNILNSVENHIINILKEYNYHQPIWQNDLHTYLTQIQKQNIDEVISNDYIRKIKKLFNLFGQTLMYWQKMFD